MQLLISNAGSGAVVPSSKPPAKRSVSDFFLPAAQKRQKRLEDAAQQKAEEKAARDVSSVEAVRLFQVMLAGHRIVAFRSSCA